MPYPAIKMVHIIAIFFNKEIFSGILVYLIYAR